MQNLLKACKGMLECANAWYKFEKCANVCKSVIMCVKMQKFEMCSKACKNMK